MKAISKILILLMVAGCSEGFVSSDLGSSDSGRDSLTLPDAGGSPEQVWQKAQDEVEGQISGGSYDGQLVVEIDRARQAVILWIPLPPIFLAPLQSPRIDGMPGVTLEYRTDGSGQTRMAAVIPIQYIIKGGNLAPYGFLPNGDAVPFMPSGESRGFAIQFPEKPKYRVHFYFVANAIAVFVETPDWKLPDELSLIPTIGFPIKNRTQTQVNGYFAIIPNKGVHSSGVFVSSRIPRELAFQLDQILRY